MSHPSSWLPELVRDGARAADGVPKQLIVVTLILLIGLGVTRLRSRSSAAQRHLVWSAACWAVLLAPVLQWSMPKYEWRVLPAASPMPSGTGTAPTAAAGSASTTRTLNNNGRETAREPVPIATAGTAASRIPWTVVVLGVWGLGTFLVLVPLLRSRRRVNGLVATASPFVDRRAHRIAAEVAVITGYRGRVDLKQHPTAMPMVCGILRPTVVLPRQATTWSDDRLRHVLLHELAHVVRHDALAQMVASLAVAVYWFHPLTWVAARELRRERERACDDVVLATGGSPSAYATDLLDLASTFTQLRIASFAALTFARSSRMRERLDAVLDTTKRRTQVSRRATVVTWSAAVGAVSLVAGLTLHPQIAVPAVAQSPTSGSVIPHGPRVKVLHVEGEPRYDIKFIRQALDDDPNIHLVTLLRTGPHRWLPMGVDDSLELASGFPTTREELFRYHAIILGSIEASSFSRDQLQLIAEFVKRGGGLLMIGGRKSFAEGGYAKTVLAEVLPVELPSGDVAALSPRQIKTNLTPTGARHPTLRIGATDSASAERWRRTPLASVVNRIVSAKSDADVLLIGTAAGTSDSLVVLATHRYGSGTAWAFLIQDSWLWKLDPSVPVEDTFHQTFWRQLLAVLSATGPQP